MSAPLPANERERLEALRRYAILDTPAEAAFDRITSLAARLLNVPIAQVTFVDKTRQWFKSSQGVQERETGRDLSFCAHAILSDETMVVTDATQDKRFQNNALVTGDPGIRSYAGVPLQSSDGFKLGTLCAIDTVSREFSTEQLEILSDLAALVIDELELRLSIQDTKKLSTAVFHAKSGIVITDPQRPDNPLVYVNPQFVEMTGYPIEEILGVNCRFLQGPETAPEEVAQIHEAIVARRTYHGEILNYRKDGTTFWNDLTISPVFNEDGELLSFVGIQYDVTERKRAAERIRVAYEKLTNLEALRDNLTSMLVHDLRSPLTTIFGSLDLLRMTVADKLTPEELAFINYAGSGAKNLAEMITTLLDVNRLQVGEMPLKLQKVDLRHTILTVIEPFRSIVGKRTLIHDLPAAPVEIQCDPDILQRVLSNLLINAVKFTSGSDEIRVSIAPVDQKVKVSVSDTGLGIPKEYHTKIFEKYGQAKGSNHRHSTGLGLTFCKLAVEAHGGSIGVESNEIKGTTFWFKI